MADNIEPLKITEFGLSTHKYQTHNAVVKEGTTNKELENPLFWANVRSKMRGHDEIRVVAEDSSFMALLLVTYVDGFQVLTKILWRVDLEATDPAELGSGQNRYITKVCGSLGWCVIDTETDAKIKTKCPSKSIAERELEEHMRALAA
jgi:hypothetical protein